MELWIKSQDRENLIRFENLFYFNNCNEMPSVGENYILNKMWIGDKDCVVLGKYKTKERALEVLDEIQSKLKQQFIVKADGLISRKDIDIEEQRLTWKYDKEFIMQDSGFEIIPVNSNVLIYEMPEE